MKNWKNRRFQKLIHAKINPVKVDMSSGKDLIKQLLKMKNAKHAKWVAPYIGNKPGFYGENDKLLGITVPEIRKVVKEFAQLSFNELDKVISSEYHEIRFAAVVILVERYKKTSEEKLMKKIYEFYLKHLYDEHINNWDFIDVSAPYICGPYLYGQPDQGKSVLVDLAKSKSVWCRRVAVLSTFYHIKQNDFDITVLLCEQLLSDEHDLIHKATGWMLREIGKKDLKSLTGFLDLYHKEMPRTMLRYSIEKLDTEKRKFYLKK